MQCGHMDARLRSAGTAATSSSVRALVEGLTCAIGKQIRADD